MSVARWTRKALGPRHTLASVLILDPPDARLLCGNRKAVVSPEARAAFMKDWEHGVHPPNWTAPKRARPCDLVWIYVVVTDEGGPVGGAAGEPSLLRHLTRGRQALAAQ